MKDKKHLTENTYQITIVVHCEKYYKESEKVKMVYSVGQKVENFAHHQECVQFDIDDNGATMLVFFDRPTRNEIEQFKADKNFEIRFIELHNVIMVTAKIGNLNWVDAPYNAHLSINLEKFSLPNEGNGLALTLILVDAHSGKIESIRLMGLSTNFTRKLFGAAMEQKMEKFDKSDYNENIRDIYAKYNTDEIVKMSSDYCKIRM